MPVFEVFVDGEVRHVCADGWRADGDEVVFYDRLVDPKTGQPEIEVARVVIVDPERNIIYVP